MIQGSLCPHQTPTIGDYANNPGSAKKNAGHEARRGE
jgi:hypothetical protein